MANLDLGAVLRTRTGLLYRIGSLLAQLRAQYPIDAEQLREALGETKVIGSFSPELEGFAKHCLEHDTKTGVSGLNPDSTSEMWVTKDGRHIRIGDMSPQHCAHALAMIVRNLRQNKYAILSDEGQIAFKERRWRAKFVDPRNYGDSA